MAIPVPFEVIYQMLKEGKEKELVMLLKKDLKESGKGTKLDT